MFQPKIRRTFVSALLVSALSLLPAHAAAQRSHRSQPARARSEGNVAVRLVAPVWDFVDSLLAKVSVRIDPNGARLTADTDPTVNEPSSQQDRNP